MNTMAYTNPAPTPKVVEGEIEEDEEAEEAEAAGLVPPQLLITEPTSALGSST